MIERSEFSKVANQPKQVEGCVLNVHTSPSHSTRFFRCFCDGDRTRCVSEREYESRPNHRGQ